MRPIQRRRLTALALVLAVACNPTICEAARRTLEAAEFAYAAAKISTAAVGDAVDALVVKLQECEDLGISTCGGLRAQLVTARAELAKWQGRLGLAGGYLEMAHLAYLRVCPDETEGAAGRLAALGYEVTPAAREAAERRDYTRADLKELEANVAQLTAEIVAEGGAR